MDRGHAHADRCEWRRGRQPDRMGGSLRRGAIVCVLLLGFVLAQVGRAPIAHADIIRYGPDFDRVQAAIVASAWPQQDHIWCGIAAMTGIANYYGANVTQRQMADYLNRPDAVSAWGTPTQDLNVAYGPAFAADISRDIGTDPRSVVYGQEISGTVRFQQIIDRISAQDATNHLIADLVQRKEPIHAVVFDGAHSVIVSGVRATGDPIADPASIVGLEVWDPGFGIPHGEIQPSQMYVVSINEWLTNKYYWAAPYDYNYRGTPRALDPDPTVGPYSYDPSQGLNAHLWIGHYVYYRTEIPTDNSVGVSADWAYNQDGDLIQGAHGERPDGYTGPVVSLLSDTVVNPVANAPTPTAATTDTPAPIPTVAPAVSLPNPFACSGASCPQVPGYALWLGGGSVLLLGGLVLLAAMRAEVSARRREDTLSTRSPWPTAHGPRAGEKSWIEMLDERNAAEEATAVVHSESRPANEAV